MWAAVAWGAAAASSLLVGMLVALLWQLSTRVIAWVMAFGAGALFSAITFELVVEAVEFAGEGVLAVGMLSGAVVFVAGSRLLDTRSNRIHGAADAGDDSGDARSIVLGAALDGVPESLAIGASLVAVAGTQSGVSVALIAAVAMSNFPEALGATRGLRAGGASVRAVVTLWGGLVLLSAVCAGIGYLALADADAQVGAALNAFAAGAVLAMLTDTMVPDSYRDGGRVAGLLVVAGFATAFLVG